MRKKITLLLLATVLACSATACGSSSDNSNTDTDSNKRGNASEVVETETTSESAEEVTEEETSEEAVDAEVFEIGQVWDVDGLWSMAILGVTEVEERNQYSDLEPGAVYMVDYVYANNGYEDSVMDGLYISIENTIVDADGEMGYSYPGSIIRYPSEIPVGAVCHAQACIGVDNPGAFQVFVSGYDSDYNRYTGEFLIDPEAEAVDLDMTSTEKTTTDTLKTGETWTVDGQWSLTITGVSELEEKNEFSELTPEAVYLVEYTYKNLGYDDEIFDGLYISLDSCIVDAKGEMGYSYSLPVSKYPQDTPVDASCDAQACIGVDHAGTFKIYFSMYDSNDVKQRQVFEVSVE